MKPSDLAVSLCPGDFNQQAMLVQAAHVRPRRRPNAVLVATTRTPHHLLPAEGFTDPPYAGVGLTEEQARDQGMAFGVTYINYARMTRPVIDDRTRGFLKLITDSRREMLLGAHAVGEQAIEVVSAVTASMAASVDVATLGRVEFAYPTYSAVIGVAARQLMAGSPSNYEHATQ